MKKFIMLSGAVLLYTNSATANFNLENLDTTNVIRNYLTNQLLIGTFEATQQGLEPITPPLSVSRPNQYLCWRTTHSAILKAQLEEIFITPSAATFSAPSGSYVTQSADGLYHHILTPMQTFGGNDIYKCWHFNEQFPVGDYKIEVKINGFALPVQTFTLVP